MEIGSLSIARGPDNDVLSELIASSSRDFGAGCGYVFRRCRKGPVAWNWLI